MRTSRATRMRIDGLSCLLAEQVFPQERLLWRACPDPKLSSAARVGLYRYGPIWRKAPWGVLGVSAGLATLAFLSTRGSGPLTDETLASAVTSAFITFYGTFFLCTVGYWIVQLTRAGRIPWAIWRWPAVRTLLGLPSVATTKDSGTPLVEPPFIHEDADPVIYGLTDRRVIILIDGRDQRVHSIWLDDIVGLRCLEAGDGWGDLTLVIEETEVDLEATESDDIVEYEEVRLFGIERVGRVAQALRCLIAQQPLGAAIAALTCGPDVTSVVEYMQQGKGVTQAAAPRARMWQATLWHGSSETQLAPCTIYGSSLAELRRQAKERLVALRPPCFSNGPTPASQDMRRLPWGQQALYLFSPSESRAAQQELDLLATDAVLGQAPPRTTWQKPEKAVGLAATRPAPARSAPRQKHARAKDAQESPQSETKSGSLEHPSPPVDTAEHPPAPEEQPQQNAVWRRKAQQGDPHTPHEFRCFDDAAEYFVTQDLLPEKGPTYEDVLLPQGSQWFHVQTVRVVDQEALANDLLRRGGWHVFTTMGMTAPRGTRGPALFVLGHPETGAV